MPRYSWHTAEVGFQHQSITIITGPFCSLKRLIDIILLNLITIRSVCDSLAVWILLTTNVCQNLVLLKSGNLTYTFGSSIFIYKLSGYMLFKSLWFND